MLPSPLAGPPSPSQTPSLAFFPPLLACRLAPRVPAGLVKNQDPLRRKRVVTPLMLSSSWRFSEGSRATLDISSFIWP
eukprot:6214657-Pleurochrysis_carterae.AAC.1